MKASIYTLLSLFSLTLFTYGEERKELSPEQRVAPEVGYYKMIIHNKTPYTLSINISIARWAPEYLLAKREGIKFYGIALDFEGIIPAFPRIEPGKSGIYKVINKRGMRIGSESSELEITAVDKEGRNMVSVFRLRDVTDREATTYVIENERRYRDKLRKLPEVEGVDLEVKLPTGYTEKEEDISEIEDLAAEITVTMEGK